MSAVRDFDAEFNRSAEAMERKLRAAPVRALRAVDLGDPAPMDTLPDALNAPLNALVRPFVWRDPASLPRREWLYGRHYIRKFISATFAPGGVGKSSLVGVEGMAMASCKPLLGTCPHQRLKVAYWNGEDPMEETERRIGAACLKYELGASDLEDWLFVGSGREMPLLIAEQTPTGTTILAPNVERVLDTAREFGLDVIIIDPFVSCHAVTENDNNAIGRVAAEWARIAGKANVSVELVHHVRKAHGPEITVEDGRGAGALLAAVRSARVLNQMSKEEAERAGVERHRSYFRVDNGKANLAPPPEGSDWFQMIGVDLENGDTFNDSDHVGVVTRWSWPDPFDGVKAADLLAVQNKIAGGLWRENSQAKEWVGIAIADVLGLALDDRAAKAKVKGLLSRWLKEGLLVKVMATDEKSRERPVVEVGKWCALG